MQPTNHLGLFLANLAPTRQYRNRPCAGQVGSLRKTHSNENINNIPPLPPGPHLGNEDAYDNDILESVEDRSDFTFTLNETH
ncbi:hypothetical protein H4Q26_015359 [Puccinia striiformis f. sp. tritici PST-130]|nr:hypothetical protein H4Q26_015359 [Puccinia striiformis f. sp. tritici PST-130]